MTTRATGALPASRRRLLLAVWAGWTSLRAIGMFAAGANLAVAPRLAPVALDLIDLDRATVAELRLLPGVGPERADAIVLERVRHGPFDGVDALRRVPGIGPATVEVLRPWVRAAR